jgi:transcriptional regulator with XRE-family HTH domain
MTSTPRVEWMPVWPIPALFNRRGSSMVGALHSDADKRFLKALVAFRVDRSVSQAELARRLDRPPSWVAKNELGERRIDPIELAETQSALERASASDCSRSLKTHVRSSTIRNNRTQTLAQGRTASRRVRLGRSAAHRVRFFATHDGGRSSRRASSACDTDRSTRNATSALRKRLSASEWRAPTIDDPRRLNNAGMGQTGIHSTLGVDVILTLLR